LLNKSINLFLKRKKKNYPKLLNGSIYCYKIFRFCLLFISHIDNKSAYQNDFWRIMWLTTGVMMLKIQLCITEINYI